MRILIVGAGATGGFYGGLLLRAGQDVTFLLRERRAQQVREQGLQIVTHTGQSLRLEPPVVSADDLRRGGHGFDLVVLSTKAYQLQGAMDDIAPVVTPQTMLLPILNGMRHLDLLRERFGSQGLLGGSVRIMSFVDPGNRIMQMDPLDQFNFGELSGEATARIQAVDKALSGAGFTNQLQPDILATLWQKWVILASIGAVCALCRGNAGQIAAVPFGAETTRTVIAECAAIAAANGYAAPPELLRQHTERMVAPTSSITSSLYRDMLAGAPVEADHILGDLLNRSRGVPAPLLQAAFAAFKVYEAARA